MKYRPDLANVLNEVSVEIAPGQHVGIVGRTGSGTVLFHRILLEKLKFSH